MTISKSFFFAVSMFSVFALSAKPQVVQSDIFYEISKGNKKAVKAWLQTKSDLSVKNIKGQTLLHVAAEVKAYRIAKMLVKAGASVNALNSAGKTALDCAVENNNKSISMLLVKYKGKVTTEQNLKTLKLMIRHHIWALAIPSFIFLGLTVYLVVVTCINLGALGTLLTIPLSGIMGISFFGTMVPMSNWVCRYSSIELLTTEK